jgi:hypothetical protein
MTVRSLRGLTVAGGIYVSGVNDTGGFLGKYSTGGDELWTRQFPSLETETVVPAALPPILVASMPVDQCFAERAKE